MAVLTHSKPNLAVEYARAHAQEAIMVLADLMRTGEKEQVRMASAIAILNRAYGTPPQSVLFQGEVTKEFDMTKLSAEELRNFHDLLGKVVEAPSVEVMPITDLAERPMKNVTPEQENP